MAVITYKCPNCGGDLQFHPETQKFYCEYCRSDFTDTEVEKPDAGNQADPSAKTEQPVGDGQTAVVYNCPSCGAEIVTDETTTATFCYYCHNPVVLAGRMQGDFHPDYVIPFAIDRQKALTIFNQWTLTYKDTKTDKIYYFACNGQTGKICGQLPVDYGRLMGLFGAIFAPLFIVMMIVGYFL